jgi:hypothetical protein
VLSLVANREIWVPSGGVRVRAVAGGVGGAAPELLARSFAAAGGAGGHGDSAWGQSGVLSEAEQRRRRS